MRGRDRGGRFEETSVIEGHVAWFESHVAGFLTGEPENDRHIRLKREHSLNVLAEAEHIADAQDLRGGQAELARLGALYHDVGRFTQYRRRRTFKDDAQVNHGFLGCRVLRQTDALAEVSPRLAALVRGVVVMHNRKRIPARLAPDLDLAVRLVRDSDKLDIVSIMLPYLRPGGERSDVVTLDMVDDPDRFNPELVRAILAGQSGEYAAMRSLNDFTILLLSWAYDLNFTASRRTFLARGYVDELAGLLPRHPVLTALKDAIYNALNG